MTVVDLEFSYGYNPDSGRTYLDQSILLDIILEPSQLEV